jgi:hypothetical protein
MMAGRTRRGAFRAVRVTGRLNSFRIEERIVMGNSLAPFDASWCFE